MSGKRRGFPVGTPRHRLMEQQRRLLVDMLRLEPNAAEVTRRYQALGGRVTLQTVCSIRRQSIASGALAPRRLRKCEDAVR